VIRGEGGVLVAVRSTTAPHQQSSGIIKPVATNTLLIVVLPSRQISIGNKLQHHHHRSMYVCMYELIDMGR
jgi:hypothetical protein